MPGSHKAHVVAPNDVFPYFPAGQSAQCVAAEALAYVPPPHGVHVIEIGSPIMVFLIVRIEGIEVPAVQPHGHVLVPPHQNVEQLEGYAPLP